MEFLLLGSVYEHKAHLHATDQLWNSIFKELDQHPTFNRCSPLYSPLAGTNKVAAKYFRLLNSFKRKYGEQSVNLSGLPGKFTREEELLFKLLQEKTFDDEKKANNKATSRELHQKFRKQDFTHGLEAGRRREFAEFDDLDDDPDGLQADEDEFHPAAKRRRAAKQGSVHDSAEFAEYKAVLLERSDRNREVQ